MKKEVKAMTIEELRARKKEIRLELDNPAADLDALEKEASEIAEREKQYEQEQRRKEIAYRVAEGEGNTIRDLSAEGKEKDAEMRAKKFAETRRTTISAKETRSVLVSGGTLATPTKVSGINDKIGAKVSSIVDMVKVVNCTGMGKNRVAYLKADVDEAAEQTEGAAAAAKEPVFGYIDISPTSVAVLSQISKQAKKQSPLQYESKVKEQALLSLRKKAASLIVAALKESELNATVDAKVTSGKGVVDAETLRKIVLAYGGDESVVGGAVLFLNKADLVALGDIRGTNEKKAVYEITPDTSNPNTGVIKDGGLSVRYCLVKGLTACSGTAQAASGGTDTLTMCYGNPRCFELDLFSDYEIRVSEDFAFDKLMDTIRGDVELGGDVVVKDGFVFLKIPKASAQGGTKIAGKGEAGTAD